MGISNQAILAASSGRELFVDALVVALMVAAATLGAFSLWSKQRTSHKRRRLVVAAGLAVTSIIIWIVSTALGFEHGYQNMAWGLIPFLVVFVAPALSSRLKGDDED